jgi:hypothetical protein
MQTSLSSLPYLLFITSVLVGLVAVCLPWGEVVVQPIYATGSSRQVPEAIGITTSWDDTIRVHGCPAEVVRLDVPALGGKLRLLHQTGKAILGLQVGCWVVFLWRHRRELTPVRCLVLVVTLSVLGMLLLCILGPACFGPSMSCTLEQVTVIGVQLAWSTAWPHLVAISLGGAAVAGSHPVGAGSKAGNEHPPARSC